MIEEIKDIIRTTRLSNKPPVSTEGFSLFPTTNFFVVGCSVFGQKRAVGK